MLTVNIYTVEKCIYDVCTMYVFLQYVVELQDV